MKWKSTRFLNNFLANRQYLILVLILVGGRLHAQPQNPSLSGPMIWLDEIGYDFGELQQGADVSHTFHVTNFGNAPLQFEVIKTSCGCDVATTPWEPIPPVGQAEFTFKYDSNRIGMLSKSFLVRTNAVNHPEINFVMKGNILLSVAEPEFEEEVSGPSVQ